MAIQKTEKIWHNGKLIAWDDATIHVMSHVIHYGSLGIRGRSLLCAARRPGNFSRAGTRPAPA